MSMLEVFGGRFGAISDLEFSVDLASVFLDGFGGYEKLICDFPVFETFCQGFDHFSFSRAEFC